MRNGVCGAWVVLIAVGIARADIDPVSGIDFVTVGAIGNRGYDGPDSQGLVAGRGSVGYTYSIGRTEITTAHWMEFYNTFKARPDSIPNSTLASPPIWGGVVDASYAGPGRRYVLDPTDADAGMRPVYGISWRQAAMYCNWLHNGKSTVLTAIDNGAYDTSTFGFSSPGVFTDQATHNPGARYWIPTLDEWLKAVHYDPNTTGPNGEQGRWWQQPNSSDITLTYGPPPSFGGDGTGQANAGFNLTTLRDEFYIPLGSYSTVTTPWGLLDAAGCNMEWTEEIRIVNDMTYRVLDGSNAGQGGAPAADWAYLLSDDQPNSTSIGSFRIASSIPAPSTLTVVFGLSCLGALRRRRAEHGRVEQKGPSCCD